MPQDYKLGPQHTSLTGYSRLYFFA